MEQMSYFEQELRRTGVSRWLLWSEYKAAYPKGYNYSQFCYHFQHWQQSQDVVMHFEYEAGDKLFVDYTGKKLELIDPHTGEVKQLEVFVAILAASHFTYVEAVRSQSKADFFGPLARALHFFGGVPRVIIPDNVKAAVIKASSYEPKLNPSMEDFVEYYQTAAMPTRAFKPRDKALVENAVRIVYGRIFAPLRKQNFYDLRSLNAAIKVQLNRHHQMPFQGLDYSRQCRSSKSQLGEVSTTASHCGACLSK
jgi:transposase